MIVFCFSRLLDFALCPLQPDDKRDMLKMQSENLCSNFGRSSLSYTVVITVNSVLMCSKDTVVGCGDTAAETLIMDRKTQLSTRTAQGHVVQRRTTVSVDIITD